MTAALPYVVTGKRVGQYTTTMLWCETCFRPGPPYIGYRGSAGPSQGRPNYFGPLKIPAGLADGLSGQGDSSPWHLGETLQASSPDL